MGGGGGGGPDIIPFNFSQLAPVIPSVANGPYNAEGAHQNEQAIANAYPWITPPAGQFAGAQPGQSAALPAGAFGGGPTPPPNPPIPPTVTPQAGGGGTNISSQFNPNLMASSAPNGMTPSGLQQIVQALMGGQGQPGMAMPPAGQPTGAPAPSNPLAAIGL